MTEPRAFDLDSIQPFYADAPRPQVGLGLTSPRSVIARQHNRTTVEISRRRAARSALDRLPGAGESIHCILRGDFALWDFVPLVLDLAGAPIDELTIATLGTSKRNIEALDQLLDGGQIKRTALLASHYFAAADADVFGHLAALAAKHKFPLAAMRSHAKILLFAIGQRRIVVESSANLRSCHNCEQATLFDDPNLYDFHRKWIFELLEKGAAI